MQQQVSYSCKKLLPHVGPHSKHMRCHQASPAQSTLLLSQQSVLVRRLETSDALHVYELRAGLRRAPLEVEAKADESPVTKADREVLRPAFLDIQPSKLHCQCSHVQCFPSCS